HFSQLILSGEPAGSGVVFIDNVLFFNENQGGLAPIQQNSYSIVPNPTSDLISIKGLQNEATLTIYNSVGQMCLATTTGAATTQIDLSSFQLGIYILNVCDHQTGQTQTYRIVKK
ncbi:MAG: Secretion system C-terminal sorting domain, partial [Bacteroidota bacterium]